VRLVCISIVLALLGGHAVAGSDDEQLYREGQAAYDAKRYDEAIAKWEQSYAISKLPALMFNLAQAHRLAGHCREAVAAYKKFVALDPEASDAPTATQLIGELEPTCPAEVEPPDTQPDKPPPHGPGTTSHVVDRGHGKRVFGAVVAGTGLALVATGLYFGNHATSLADEVRTACASGCEWATVEDKDAAGKRAELLQYVFLGSGAAAIVAGVATYAIGVRSKTVVVEPRGAGVAVTLRW